MLDFDEARIVRKLLKNTVHTRISNRLLYGLLEKGVWIQKEHPLHEGVFYYLMDRNNTREVAQKLLDEFDKNWKKDEEAQTS